ncbi:Tripartite-type tricarboxylate transporter receptor subunit TctC OS=Castellaniella defragrans OX=75697 GN=HNR28_001854 PE=3 SV=1 [Castellaniella defragrans]
MAYGSVGAGSATNLGAELLKRALHADPIHVPYNGGPAVITALIGGQIQMALLPVSTARSQIDAGKVAAIAVVSAKRSPLLPTLPGLEELGIHNINIEVWNAFMAPARMPEEHRVRLSQALQQILKSDDIRHSLQVQGWQVDDPSPQALEARIAADRATYKDLIAQTGIKLD